MFKGVPVISSNSLASKRSGSPSRFSPLMCSRIEMNGLSYSKVLLFARNDRFLVLLVLVRN